MSKNGENFAKVRDALLGERIKSMDHIIDGGIRLHTESGRAIEIASVKPGPNSNTPKLSFKLTLPETVMLE